MSKTLNLIDILLSSGRQLFMMGRFTEALVPLTKLSEFRKLPRTVLEEMQSLLAEIHLAQLNYKQARRHLAAAIAIRPLCAEYHYLMAIAIEKDEDADRHRAEAYYERAVQIEPEEPSYLVDFASYLFALGKDKDALKAIRKAYALGTTDADIVGEVTLILRREELFEEATTKLRAALFHNHGSQVFRQLWQQHQFAMIHADQRKRKSPVDGSNEDAVILPFVATPGHGKYMELGPRTIRMDQAEPTSEPKKKQPAPTRRPPRKG